jgi:hypothetical protein
MAKSPSHSFGQNLGTFLEDIVLNLILKPRLEQFTDKNKYFLDSHGTRKARKGKKLSWSDRYGNNHDLDFVIEAGGTPEKTGTPIAFIEAAWRRYTKHSKNKAQEIQGAILPIIELHNLFAPFHGAVLAGEFSKPAIDQLKNNKFSVLHFSYKNVVDAFKSINFDIKFDEKTSHTEFENATARILSLSKTDKDSLSNELIRICKQEIDKFMLSLQNTLERLIKKVVIIPLFGSEIEFLNVPDAIEILNSLDFIKAAGDFKKIEVIVDYNNGDCIRASFLKKTDAGNFLKGLIT